VRVGMRQVRGCVLGVVIVAMPFAVAVVAARLELEWRWAFWLVGVGALPVVALVVREGIRVARSGESALRKGLKIGLWVVVAAVIGGSLHFSGVGMYALVLKEQMAAKKAVCLSNVKHLTLAMMNYAEEHEGRLPSAETWCDDLLPYVRGEDAFACPEAPELTCAFAYNTALSGVSTESIADAVSVVLIFEGTAGWNAAGGPELLPDEPRHFWGEDYGFADGHSAWWPRAYAEVEGGEERRYEKRPRAEDVRWEVEGEGT